MADHCNAITLFTDRTRLRQILYNLLSNAAKFTHDGLITVSCWQDGGSTGPVHIEVKDTGIGMNQYEAEMIFERFYRSEAQVVQYNQGGTGLGLAICRMLCSAMGGVIRVSSVEGTGSVFTVTLPHEMPGKRTISDKKGVS